MGIIIKNEKQIEGIRKSCQLAADVLDHLEQFVKIGVSTEELNKEADKYIRDYGATPAPLNYNGFPKSICTSLNEVICHGIPREDVVLKDGDILNIDVTTILDGFYGDTCRMFAIGDISETAKKMIAVAQDCLDIGISKVRPNNEFWMIGKAIQDYAHSRGCSVVRMFAGHGTGLKFHEEPQVSHDYDPERCDKRKMEPGMIFTIEPMICEKRPEGIILGDGWTAVTMDGGLSTQFEHTVLVVDGGVEVLTK